MFLSSELKDGASGVLGLCRFSDGTVALGSDLYKNSVIAMFSLAENYNFFNEIEGYFLLDAFVSSIPKVYVVARESCCGNDVVICADLNIDKDIFAFDSHSVFFLATVTAGSTSLPNSWYRTEYFWDYSKAELKLTEVVKNLQGRN